MNDVNKIDRFASRSIFSSVQSMHDSAQAQEKQNALYEISHEVMMNLFEKLGITTNVEDNVLIEHIVKAGEKTEKWSKIFNQLVEQKASVALSELYSPYGARRKSHLSRRRLSEIEGITLKFDESASTSNVNDEKVKIIAKKNRFKRIVRMVMAENRVRKQSIIGGAVQKEMNEDIEDFNDMKLEECLEKMKGLKSNVIHAHEELGMKLLYYQEKDEPKFNELVSKLKLSSLRDNPFIWIIIAASYSYTTHERLNEESIAKKSSAVFYKFDYQGQWLNG